MRDSELVNNALEIGYAPECLVAHRETRRSQEKPSSDLRSEPTPYDERSVASDTERIRAFLKEIEELKRKIRAMRVLLRRRRETLTGTLAESNDTGDKLK